MIQEATISNLLPFYLVQKCQRCQLCVFWQNSIPKQFNCKIILYKQIDTKGLLNSHVEGNFGTNGSVAHYGLNNEPKLIRGSCT